MLEEFNRQLTEVFVVIDLIGVLLNGILGGRIARQKGFDIVGFSVLAIMCALAGGILRDLILSAGPPIAITNKYYLITALTGAVIAWLWPLNGKWSVRVLLLFDGIILGCWSATGAAKTLGLGFGVIPAIMLGMMTSIGGGMIRDISAGNVPTVFGGNTLYATPAFVSAGVMVIFFKLDLMMIGMLVATIVGTVFTVIANWRNWKLPQNQLHLTPAQLKTVLKLRNKHYDFDCSDKNVNGSVFYGNIKVDEDSFDADKSSGSDKGNGLNTNCDSKDFGCDNFESE